MVHLNRFLFSFSCILLLLSPLVAQEQGRLFVENYSPRLYKADPQNWAVVQNKQGIMYFANDQGVLEYDGKNWRLISTSNNSAVRSLALGPDGRVFVGASKEFGYLAPDSLGEMQYISLSHSLAPRDKTFEDIWTTQAAKDAIFFQSDYILFRYDLAKKIIKTWYAPKDSYFFLSFYVNDQLYIHEPSQGLMIWEKGKIRLLKGGDFFKGKKIYTLLSYDANNLLVGTRKEGLFTFNEKKSEETRIQKFEHEAESLLLEAQLYNAHQYSPEQYAFCTRQGGLIILNKQGQLIQIINRDEGLPNENIRFAYRSNENLLWLALNNGISKVDLNSPLTFWNQQVGLRGAIRGITRFEGKIYVATAQGVFYLDGKQMKEVPNLDLECWNLLLYKEPENGQPHLLIAAYDGIYEVKNQVGVPILSTSPKAVLKLYQSRYQPGQVFVGLKGGLQSILFENGKWVDQGKFVQLDDEIYSITEENEHTLWLGTFIQGLIRIEHGNDKTEISRFGKESGLPNLRNIQVYQYQNRLFFATQGGLYHYDKPKKQFIPEPSLGTFLADGSRGVYTMMEDQKGNFWIADQNNSRSAIGVAISQSNAYIWHDQSLRLLPEFNLPVIFPESDGKVWIGGTEGLFRYFFQSKILDQSFENEFLPILREVNINQDSTLFKGGNYNFDTLDSPDADKASELLTFPFQPNFSISFEYVSPYFVQEKANQYSYYLDVRDQTWLSSYVDDAHPQNWTPWSEDNKTRFTNLTEGTYVFYVKSRNIYGQESEATAFEFRILPPWYRTGLAYFFYALIFLTLLLLSVRIYTFRLRRQKEILAQIVDERTQEIRRKNDRLQIQSAEIAQQKQDIEDKNKDITASINYASRIQEAMLPLKTAIDRAFTDNFIIYRPRDIVSGDFYWFYETPPEPRFNKKPHIEGIPSVFDGFSDGKKIIAAVDCTGHGVPGAFMSMTGDAYLNQIINLEGIHQPHLILKELDLQIKKALKQEETENIDGMDMAICVINPNNKTLEYAGAKNPILYIQNGEINYIKGDRFGIGGFILNPNEEKAFQRHVIKLDQPTHFYIFSDGMPDQFGGDRGRKFMTKRIRQVILENHQKPMAVQKEALEAALDNWMDGYEQVDDILLLGIYIDPAASKKD